MSDYTIPERGVLGILIVDLASKNALLLFNLLSARKRFKTSILFVIVFIIFPRNICYLVQILILYTNLSIFFLNYTSFTKIIILTNIKNKSISTKIHQENLYFISAEITKRPSNNGGQTIAVSKILIQL